MSKFHTVQKCLQCKFCEVGRRYAKSTYMYRDLQTVVIMCGATGKFYLISKNQAEDNSVALPDWCPLPETDQEDGLAALVTA